MVKDPVCGMEVDERTASFHTAHGGEEIFYFCSERCKRVFDEGLEADAIQKMSWWQRFLRRLGNASQKQYGGKPPSCH
jgi:YHS domain-containing protein